MSDLDALARFYDLEHADISDDVRMYVHLAQQHGSPILEVGCGTGRVLLPLVRAGYTVTGVDSSPAMMERARAKLAVEPAAVRGRALLRQADIRDSALGGGFRLAILAINTFMHLTTRADQLRALGAIHRELADAGKLVIDVNSPYLFLLAGAAEPLMLHRRLVDPETGRPILKLITARFDHANQVQHLTLIYDETDDNGCVHRTLMEIPLRYVFRFEMELLLERAGFSVDAVYGSTEMDPYEDECEKMIFLASKR